MVLVMLLVLCSFFKTICSGTFAAIVACAGAGVTSGFIFGLATTLPEIFVVFVDDVEDITVVGLDKQSGGLLSICCCCNGGPGAVALLLGLISIEVNDEDDLAN